jgi:EmrB/QacA subfamily drug resistance transporter
MSHPTESRPDAEGGPPSAGGTASDTVEEAPSTRSWAVPLAVLIVGMFMSVLDITIVNVAIPAIQRDFGTTTEDIQWITTAYSLALGVIVPVSGWLGDRVGLTRAYNVSLLAFAAGSALCGLAWHLESMVLFRIVQAIPGGILPVVTLTMVYRIVPREKIGTAMGLYGLGIVFAPAIGPTLGGYLVEYVDWRLIFFINVPIGLLGAVLGYLMLPAFPQARAARFDVLGFLTVAVAMFSLLLALSKGQDWGWTSYRVLMLIVGGLLSLALFVVIELEIDNPLLDMRVFKLWPFTNSLLLITVLSVGLFAVLFYVPLYVQEGLRIQPLRTGLLLLPEALVMGLTMPVAGRLYDLIGPRWPAAVGLAIAAYGTYLLCGINADMTQRDVVIWTCIRALGNGLAMMSIMTAGLAAVPPDQVNGASAINNVVQRVASALGLAVLTSMAATHQAQVLADRSNRMVLSDTHGPPGLADLVERGPMGLYPVMQRLQLEVTATAYSNVFLVCAILTGAGAVLALMFKVPHGADSAPATPAPLEGVPVPPPH